MSPVTHEKVFTVGSTYHVLIGKERHFFMAKMVEAEIQYRNRKRTEMYLRTSRLRYNTVMEGVIC